MDQYYTAEEAARLMGISRRGLFDRIRVGAVKAERFGQRAWMIPHSEVDRLRGAGRMRPGPKPQAGRAPTAAPTTSAQECHHG